MILCSRRVGTCAPAVTALSASIDAQSVEQEPEPSECTEPRFFERTGSEEFPKSTIVVLGKRPGSEGNRTLAFVPLCA